MCGIVGLFSPERNVSETTLISMQDRLVHRGPDSAGSWIGQYDNGVVALAHRRLSIIDLSKHSDQPMSSLDNKKRIIFNGEIYNYAELKRQLENKGHKFRTRGDTEVLLHAYEEWGDACLYKLNGMFAFIIWDELRGKAFIARDRFGEKPLFFSKLSSGGIAFASEIKALMANPEITCNLNVKLADAIVSGYVPYGGSDTLFEKVEQVLPAHFMTISTNGDILEYKQYWKPDYEDIDTESTEKQLNLKFIKLLKKSVSLRARSDVRNSACLSGGIDSSTIVSLLSKDSFFRADKSKPISVVFPEDLTISEGDYIDTVLKYSSLNGSLITPCAKSLSEDIQRLHWHHETVIPGPSMYLEWCVMKHASESGYKVMLDGQGADELLAGYQTYYEAFQYDTYKNKEWVKFFKNEFFKRYHLWVASLKYSDYQRRFSRRPGLKYNRIKHYKEDTLDRIWMEYDYIGSPAKSDGNILQYMLAAHIMKVSLQSNLHSGDRNSMAHGVECRYPYLDYELVDFCLRLPRKAYIHNGWQKSILRKATKKLLPNKIRWRPDKVGFASPQDTWLKNELKTWVEERIFDPSLNSIDSYNETALRHMWSEHQSGTLDHSTSLWQWASLSECNNMFLSGSWRNGI